MPKNIAQPKGPVPKTPHKKSDAGKVAAMVAKQPGLPAWALSRNTGLSLDGMYSTLAYLRVLGQVTYTRGEFDRPDGKGRGMYKLWFPASGVLPSTPNPASSATRCREPMGHLRTCDTRLEFATDNIGRLVASCPACERRRRGVCRACPNPVPPASVVGPRPWYCAACAKRLRNEQALARYHERAKARRAHGLPSR